MTSLCLDYKPSSRDLMAHLFVNLALLLAHYRLGECMNTAMSRAVSLIC